MKQFAECEWNFSDSARVPDEELVACCHWEYARESAFIRDVVQNLKDVDQGKGSRKPLDAANRDLTRFYSIGTPAHLVYHPKFPKPWQSLFKKERARLTANFKPEIPVPEKIPAFQITGNYSIASQLFNEAKRVHEARQAMWRRLSEIDRGAANLKEAADLRKQLAAPLPSQIVCGGGGVGSFIAQMNWQDFTDNEIVAAFKRWIVGIKRPIGQRNKKGHKLNDWRVMLDRLAIMRLLHHATLNEMPEKFPDAWKRYGERKAVTENQKDYGGVDWYRESKNAKRDFHRLFPFLPKSELPSSWRTKGGRR